MTEKSKAFSKNNFYTAKDSGSAFLLTNLIPYAVAFLLTFVLMMISSSNGTDLDVLMESLPVTIVISLLTPAIIIGLFFGYNKIYKIPLKESGLTKKINITTVLVSIAIAVVCVFGALYLVNSFDILFEFLGYEMPKWSFPIDNFGFYVLNLVLFAGLPAIGEELIFRGIIFQGLRKNYSTIISVVFSSLLFALVHGSLVQFIYPFILGLILSVLRLRTNSLIVPIIVHFFNNAIVVTSEYIKTVTGFDFCAVPLWLTIVLGVVLFIVAGVILFLVDRFYFKKKFKTEEVQVEKTSFSFSMILGIVFSLFIFVYNTVIGFMDKA